MPVRYVSVGSGSQALTLNQLIAAPTVIAERFLAVTQNQFVMERVLRYAGQAPGGAVQYRVSSPIFADQGSEIVNERAEIPLATISKGDLATAPTRPSALGVGISYEMQEMDVTGEVLRQIGMVKNTLIRDFDVRFLNVLTAQVAQTVTAAFPWSSGSATLRKNLNAAKLIVAQAIAPNTTNAYMGFRADTIVLNPATEADLLNSNEFTNMIFGQVQGSAIGALADLPQGNVLGLQPLITPSMPTGRAFVCQRGVVGGYADRVALSMSELYDWPPARIHRADAYRDSVAFVDQPLAGVWINGI